MCCKAAETTCNINDALVSGIANEYTGQWWFKKFCKGGEILEDEEHNGRPLNGDNSKFRDVIEANPLITI